MSNGLKFLIVTFIVCTTFFYAHYEKRKVDELTMDSGFVLKTIPQFDGQLLENSTSYSSTDYVSKFPATMVHFWGTWCAPCEAEFPDLLKFAKKVENKNVKFLLVAMNDTEIKVRKFLKRFKEVPSNIAISVKEDTSLMSRFGTFKVPETYLFDRGGSLLTKYVGPQDWLNNSYSRQIDRLVFGSKEKLLKIETH